MIPVNVSALGIVGAGLNTVPIVWATPYKRGMRDLVIRQARRSQVAVEASAASKQNGHDDVP